VLTGDHFSIYPSRSWGPAARIWLRCLVYGKCVFMGSDCGSCQSALYPAGISRCLHKLTAQENCCKKQNLFFFLLYKAMFLQQQSHTNTGLDSSSGEECCYASLNKLVFKQSFLWFTADGGMWLMLPFKTLVL